MYCKFFEAYAELLKKKNWCPINIDEICANLHTYPIDRME